MRIGLIVRVNPNWAGGTYYVLTWMHALNALPPAERPEIILLYGTSNAEREVRQYASIVDGIEDVQHISRLGLDFVYPAKEVFEAPPGVPWAGWLPDWQQRYLPEMFSEDERQLRELRYRVLVQNCPVMVLSSQMALDDTARWISEPHAPLTKLTFVALIDPQVADVDSRATLRTLEVPEEYILNCNQWFRHKNHKTLIEALAILRDDGLRVPCVFTGRTDDHRWPDHFPQLQRLIDERALKDEVQILGHVPRADQLQLIRGARAVVQPSLFEGWSTIVEEARALGKAAILSDIPVHREQNPPGAHYFEPTDARQLADTIRDAWAREPREQPDLARERAALLSHQEASRQVARQLLEIGRTASSRYKPTEHSPAVGAVRMLSEIARDQAAVGGEPAREFAVRASRAMLKRYPDLEQQFSALAAEAQLPASLAVTEPPAVPVPEQPAASPAPAPAPAKRRSLQGRARKVARGTLSRLGLLEVVKNLVSRRDSSG